MLFRQQACPRLAETHGAASTATLHGAHEIKKHAKKDDQRQYLEKETEQGRTLLGIGCNLDALIGKPFDYIGIIDKLFGKEFRTIRLDALNTCVRYRNFLQSTRLSQRTDFGDGQFLLACRPGIVLHGNH